MPSPKTHTVRYAGVLAAHSKWRPLIVPPAQTETTEDSTGDAALEHEDRPAMHRRSTYRPWAELLRRTFAFDVELCPRCGGRMRLVALVTAAQSITRILKHLGEPTEPPLRAPARGPPYFASAALRAKPAEQRALFD